MRCYCCDADNANPTTHINRLGEEIVEYYCAKCDHEIRRAWDVDLEKLGEILLGDSTDINTSELSTVQSQWMCDEVGDT